MLTVDDVRAASGGDLLALWAARRLGRGGRAWADGELVLVASPAASRRDRLVVVGPLDTPRGAARAARAVRAALAEVGAAYKPLLDRSAALAVREHLPAGTGCACFGWMDTDVPPPAPDGAPVVDVDDEAEVAALLDEAAPESYARPGDPDVHRWLGVREGGALLGVAAEAWNAPEVGFLAGVATRPAARGRGVARAVCAVGLARLVRRHGAAALMVDDDNAAALAIYARLGLRLRPVAGLSVPSVP
nr:GNAT family N-acetyltransferase [Motilibacter deserti]